MSAPLVTGETTIAELCEILAGREITGLRLSLSTRRYAGEPVSLGVDSGSCVSERNWSTHRSRTAPAHSTVTEALSALLGEIPEVNR